MQAQTTSSISQTTPDSSFFGLNRVTVRAALKERIKAEAKEQARLRQEATALRDAARRVNANEPDAGWTPTYHRIYRRHLVRSLLLAYGFLRGKSFSQLEPNAADHSANVKTLVGFLLKPDSPSTSEAWALTGNAKTPLSERHAMLVKALEEWEKAAKP